LGAAGAMIPHPEALHSILAPVRGWTSITLALEQAARPSSDRATTTVALFLHIFVSFPYLIIFV
jgi:hypothetical protein